MIDHYYHHLAQTSIRTMRIVIIYLSVNVIIMIDHHKHHLAQTQHKDNEYHHDDHHYNLC